ncbi:MAG: hypothetical protein U0326_25010 [Polyangiales bacterium]
MAEPGSAQAQGRRGGLLIDGYEVRARERRAPIYIVPKAGSLNQPIEADEPKGKRKAVQVPVIPEGSGQIEEFVWKSKT